MISPTTVQAINARSTLRTILRKPFMNHEHVIRGFLAAILLVWVRGQDTPTTCVFEDGQEFQPGANVGDAFTNRCGNSTEYPCFCDPTLPFLVFCPYCGFAVGDGTLYCARDSETISFPDGNITRQCSCDFSDDHAEDPTRNCTISEEQQLGAPSGQPITGGVGTCTVSDANGTIVEVGDGDSFGELIEGACGPASDWPSFCRIQDDQGEFVVEYPYCVHYDVKSGVTVCARDGESLSYVNDDGVDITCMCAYTSDKGSDPECRESDGRPLPPGQSDASGGPTASSPSGNSAISRAPTSRAPTPTPSGSSRSLNRRLTQLMCLQFVLLNLLQCC